MIKKLNKMANLKIYVILLIIFYILFIYTIYYYYCCNILHKKNIIRENFSETSYIYIKNFQDNKLVKFYNKNYNNYMTFKWQPFKKFIIYDKNQKIIGKLHNEKNNRYVIETIIYPKSLIIIELYNNYENVKMYKEHSNDYFYLKKNNRLYLHALYMGKINENKIIAYKEYKEYLNLFAFGYIIRQNELLNIY